MLTEAIIQRPVYNTVDLVKDVVAYCERAESVPGIEVILTTLAISQLPVTCICVLLHFTVCMDEAALIYCFLLFSSRRSGGLCCCGAQDGEDISIDMAG